MPKHTRRYANLAEDARKAMAAYIKDVEENTFPGPDESFE